MVPIYPKMAERRKNPDRFIRIINGLVLMSFFLVLLIFIIAVDPTSYKDFAGVRHLSEIFGEPLEKNMMRFAFYLMILQLCISTGGYSLSMFYHKRRTDRYHYSLIVFGALSLIGILLYLYFA